MFTILAHSSVVSSQPTITIIQVLDWQNTVISTITIILAYLKSGALYAFFLNFNFVFLYFTTPV